MENFDLFGTDEIEKEAKLMVSPPCEKDGKIYAFVSVNWNNKSAEFKIPSCEVIANNGFTEDQMDVLIEYIKENVPMLKKEAAGINILENMFGGFSKK